MLGIGICTTDIKNWNEEAVRKALSTDGKLYEYYMEDTGKDANVSIIDWLAEYDIEVGQVIARHLNSIHRCSIFSYVRLGEDSDAGVFMVYCSPFEEVEKGDIRGDEEVKVILDEKINSMVRNAQRELKAEEEDDIAYVIE